MVTEEFLRAFFGTDAAVLVGELAADLEGVIDLPEGSRVIGSIVYSERSRAFFTVVDDAESVVGFFRARLVADGWRAPEERPNPRGFQRPETTGSSETFCGPAR